MISTAFALVTLVCTTPPQVVSIEPAHGADFVDPTRSEIRVIFDQDMQPGMSWVGGGPEFPPSAATAHWVSPRECVFPVQLGPDHRYNLVLNRGKYSNFRSVDGEELASVPWSFRTRELDAVRPPSPPRELNTACLEETRALIERRYSYRDRLHIDWGQRFASARDQLINATSPFQFAIYLGALLGEADDPHVAVHVDGGRVPTSFHDAPISDNIRSFGRQLDGARQPSPVIFTGRVDERIAYLAIGTFDKKRADQILVARDIIADLEGVDVLILDVRPNGGGSETVASKIAACFVTEESVYAAHTTLEPGRDGPLAFQPRVDRVLRPDPTAPHFGGRVLLLQGPSVLSSAEAFVLMMRQAPRCETVGMVTGGSSGNPERYELANGVTVQLPTWRTMRPDGTCFEGVGIAPDHLVDAAPADFANGDPIYERAIELARQGIK